MQQKDLSSFKSSEEAAEYFGKYQTKLATFIIQQINISINSLLNILSQKFKLETTKAIFEKSNLELVKYAEEQK
ncbi:hypothetical protein [Winogradskyella costae]|uniref:hypothetical protein n=1 Tax=Winogradskyella costae TaxID=2697008 RepID=UPI0015CA1092|nr:hypothetical protein [Winogradskyella costae]